MKDAIVAALLSPPDAVSNARMKKDWKTKLRPCWYDLMYPR
eukprot:CAMPEP_0196147736 /NCGR_PEP_ID=MMETSP0910-20130528/26113_1 /TAXON_ID=49265 /ORGANISM="Thalassiosira rotula, Strain GSO102" /LENGTH=40 /DNA_ID= /DNA_START= /DNA_END= /DNA_ORIENTATION=